MTDAINVLIIGAGPAGLSAATELKRRGIARVVMLEREDTAGGIPRHCGHPPFGFREFKRVLTGLKYAEKLVSTALKAGVEIQLSTTVVEAQADGKLLISSDAGVEEITAQRVIYATGVRETPRSARLVSGKRPLGIVNTGALQSMVYLHKRRPFKRPVIVGSELVSFSAIQTCRHAKIKPVAIIEASSSVIARWPTALFARLMGVPVYLQTKIIRIKGDKKVSAVIIENNNGEQQAIDCDGIIFSGSFMPEATLARSGHLLLDSGSGGPVVDQFGRCSDPVYFAAGNILRPVETAGWSWNEGRQIGGWVADDLEGVLTLTKCEINITSSDDLIKLYVPQRIALPYNSNEGMENLQLRFSKMTRGELTIVSDKEVIWRKKLKVYPERRVLIPIKVFIHKNQNHQIELKFREL
ncbi:MAG TPA: FAD-dependent oxidoreductase [Leucothrix mucor]|nr:FAD-dependent oxidoreductase [Leucothrix mucor]